MQHLLRTLFLVVVGGIHTITFSQNNIDSLKQLLSIQQTDTSYVNTALDIAWQYMYVETDSAVVYGEKGKQRAQNANLPLLLASCYNTIGVCNIVKADYYEALAYLSKGIDICNELLERDSTKKVYKRRALAIYANIGNIYYFQGKYDKTINNYLKALRLSEEIGFENGIAVASSNLAAAYKDIYNFDKALEYNYRSLALAKKIDDRFSLTQALNNLGSVYFSIPDYDSAYYYFFSCMKLNIEDNNEYELINNYVNMADVMRETNTYDSALYYFDKSLKLSNKLNSIDGLINVNYMIGQLYLKTDDLPQAIGYYKESLRLAKESGTSRFVMMASEQLAEVYKKQKNYELALEYFQFGSLTRDSIFNAESDERIADMEAKYRTEKKEEEIRFLQENARLQEEQTRTSKMVYLSIIVILALVVILVYISYRSYKNKQLAERRKIEQDAEKQLLDATIETEYRERKRFAEDLHDGLGVLLSATKLYINEIADSEGEERQSFIKQSNAMLDEAIANARNISNNIMPAALKNNGLEGALRSFTEKINASGKINIDVQAMDLDTQHNSIVEITVYRIIKEMINNTLKHARASEAFLSMVQKENTLYISYKDNGQGFDYEKMIRSTDKGMGLDNAVNRINSIGGTCSIESKKGEGFKAEFVVAV